MCPKFLRPDARLGISWSHLTKPNKIPVQSSDLKSQSSLKYLKSETSELNFTKIFKILKSNPSAQSQFDCWTAMKPKIFLVVVLLVINDGEVMQMLRFNNCQ